jgi:hypothetical protein
VWVRQIPTPIPTTVTPRMFLSARAAAVEAVPHFTNCYNTTTLVLSPVMCLQLFCPVHQLNTSSWTPVVCFYLIHRVLISHVLKTVILKLYINTLFSALSEIFCDSETQA